MEKATIRNYGTASFVVDFDPTNYDSNIYDLYAVAVCDWENEEVLEEERYLNEEEYRSALRDTCGREVMDEQEHAGFCDVYYNGEQHECECIYHIAYVVDHEEE